MSLSVCIQATNPLFRKLKGGLLWHCTKVSNYHQIVASGSILPLLPEQQNRWGSRRYACQTINAVCLFDFHTAPEALVLQAADRWQQFLFLDSPLTVLIGLDERRLSGRLVRYPENRDTTPKDSCGPIPYVEVCHVGPIPVSSFAAHILVCADNLDVFRCVEVATENMLAETSQEFEAIVAAATEIKAAALAASRASPKYQELLRMTQQVRRQRTEKRGLDN